ncbi:MAG TPA: hypothetical protein VMM36_02810 [Opitutaceae bacterium]|nr:hypothetical protein [Opitutaceae bacterium]
MPAKDRSEFIKSVVAGHRPAAPMMLPGRRALIWFALVIVGTAIAMRVDQEYRPGFTEQLLQHPALLIEVAAAFALTLLGAYAAFVRAVPGERVPRWAVTALWISGILFCAGLAAEFTHLAPESSSLGARAHCWTEVPIYGGAGMLAFVLMVRRGVVRFSWLHGLGYGIAGLVPGTLMQLACMYEPVHNMLYHFLPALPVIAIGLVLMKRLAIRAARE